jgi:PAS domain S-box
LTDAFNQMLTQIQSQDSALQTAQHELQEQVTALQHEIGERKRAEREQVRLTAILEATPDIVMSANRNGIPFYLNRAGHEILGVAQDRDISGMKTLYLRSEWANGILAKERLPEAIRNGSWAGETTIFTRDGKEIPVSQVLIAHKSPEGAVEYFRRSYAT